MIKISYNRDLSGLNTFGMKVKAACYVEYGKAEDLPAIGWDDLPRPLLPVGSGSNLLFTGDFPGTVLHSTYDMIRILEDRSEGDTVIVEAGSGVIFDEFCRWAAGKNLWGPENLSGIPGTVGACAVQNVGAYGVEAGDLIEEVVCFEIASRSFRRIAAKDCAFAYRDSYFKHNRGRYIVASVVFRLTSLLAPQLDYGHLREAVERNIEFQQAASNPYMPAIEPTFGMPRMQLTPMLVRDTVRIIRDGKLPDPAKTGSAGSFFKNPVVSADVFAQVVRTARAEKGEGVKVPHYILEDGSIKIPAAWMIDFCGFKGKRHGGAMVWPMQPLVLVNAEGKATPQEIMELENEIKYAIKEKFGIGLECEVDHI